jgi:hypothetical protein
MTPLRIASHKQIRTVYIQRQSLERVGLLWFVKTQSQGEELNYFTLDFEDTKPRLAYFSAFIKRITRSSKNVNRPDISLSVN